MSPHLVTAIFIGMAVAGVWLLIWWPICRHSEKKRLARERAEQRKRLSKEW